MICNCLPFLQDLFDLFPTAVNFLEALSLFRGSKARVVDPKGRSTRGSELQSWQSLGEILDAKTDIPSESFAKSRLRLFGDDKEPLLLLYRDNSAWCPFSEKVWIALEEKQISYATKTVKLSVYGEKEAWFWDINPKGLVPVIDVKGEIVTESYDILVFLEDAFPKHKRLYPAKGTPERAWIEELLLLDSQLITLQSQAIRSDSWEILTTIEKIFDEIDAALRVNEGPFFLGHEFSVADAAFASSVERTVSVLPYFFGVQLRLSGRWPAVDTWFETLLTRESSKHIISDDFTTVHNALRAFNPIKLPGGAAFRAEIDGTNGSWDLPLKPVHFPLGSDDGTGTHGAKWEAAKTIVHNHENVLVFTLLGIADDGAEKYKDQVDLALRYVSHALLLGVDNVSQLPKTLVNSPAEIATAIKFLRDRISTPRDLSFPAARQLRAHLHWFVKQISSSFQKPI